MKFMRWAVWVLDETLDAVPTYEHGRWYRYGQWGCRLRLARFWWREDCGPQRRPRDEDGWIASPTQDRIGK